MCLTGLTCTAQWHAVLRRVNRRTRPVFDGVLLDVNAVYPPDNVAEPPGSALAIQSPVPKVLPDGV
jgi:hypothetical protein